MSSSFFIFFFFFFFFSSRRRHTRSTRDWSSDVCSSDLDVLGNRPRHGVDVGGFRDYATAVAGRSEERRVGKSVDLGGRRINKKKKKREKKRNGKDVKPI